LGDDVDRGRLQLDEEDLRVDLRELAEQRDAVGEVPRQVDDVRIQPVDGRGTGREDGGSATAQRLERAQAQGRVDDAYVLDRRRGTAIDAYNQIRDQHAVRVQVVVEIVLRTGNEHACARRHGRDRRAAAVE